MKPCFAIEIITPKRCQLNGLWFGPARPKRVIIFIHGLGGSVFGNHKLIAGWVDKKTAVITFNNRGHGKISKIHRLTNAKKGYENILIGQAHEVFSECADDIQGAINFAKKRNVKEIYLAGHSTGCQKSAYYTGKKIDKAVKGLILLAPISDYASIVKFSTGDRFAKATKIAKTMVKAGKKHELLPSNIWNDVMDAQRFLSLYTPNSVEEIFSYAQPKKNPVILKKIKLPMLVFLAGRDEFGDRPVEDIAAWFEKHMNAKSEVKIIQGVAHSFNGGEARMSKILRNWLKNQ